MSKVIQCSTGEIFLARKRERTRRFRTENVKAMGLPGLEVEMAYRLEFEIPGLPKILSNGSHSNFRAVHALKKRWKQLVALSVGYRKPVRPLQKAKITCIRHSTRKPDFDNLAISFKPILDGLRDCGVIADDNQGVIGRATYDWQPAKMREGKITVIIEEET